MLVCHCFQITDREIAREAARGARRPEDLSTSCPAGQGCGGCSALVERILQGVPTTACGRRAGAAPTESVAPVAEESPMRESAGSRRKVQVSSSRIAVRDSERRDRA